MKSAFLTIVSCSLLCVCCNGAQTDPLNEFPQDSARGNGNALPPYTDYCAMLSQEIQGKKHAFMAGNLVYYVGGFHDCWNKKEDETIGLTHPFFHDLRSRGHDMVEHPGSGYGHDFQGWEFYKHTKVAYGTVIIRGKEYKYPAPSKMYWRPDKMICQYSVGGVNIREEKFVANNDVACSIITSDRPVTIRFDGNSFAMSGKNRQSTASVRYDRPNNTVHIVEGGKIEIKPVEGEHRVGKLMYNGMSTVISGSKNFGDSYSSHRDKLGRQVYSFEVPCDSKGFMLTWAMDDKYANALERTAHVLANPASRLAAKTKKMNDLLNYQIPYFRCSDEDIVNVYYYLWSIYLMYYIDVGQGWEKYPHTQTAVNNFLGLHRYDANFQIKVGAWTADKEYYAYGNALLWKSLLPYAKKGGALPDNMGIAWYSPVWGTTTEHVVGAWQIYEHTGDIEFIEDCYEDFYRPLFWNGMHSHWGAHYDAAECLRKMAVLTGHPEDADHWHKVVNMDGRDKWLDNMWEANGVKDFFGAGKGALDWSGFAYLRNSYFPEDWAARMTKTWAIDNIQGFFSKVPLGTKALKDWEHASDVFSYTPDTNYYSIIGMYKRNVGRKANICGVTHLKKYNMHWGIPVAPEAWDKTPRPWGDQYSNFNAGKILLILEGIAGIEYSIPGEIFTVRDTMPEEWDFMEVTVPVTKVDDTHWSRVNIQRKRHPDRTISKTVAVSGNSLSRLRIEPWLEGKALRKATSGYVDMKSQGRVGYTFSDAANKVVMVNLDE